MSIAAMFNAAASPLGPMHCWSFGNSDVRALTGGIDKLYKLVLDLTDGMSLPLLVQAAAFSSIA